MPLSSFQAVTALKILERDPRDEILRAFELFDEGGKGFIDLEDLRRVARELGETGLEEERGTWKDWCARTARIRHLVKFRLLPVRCPGFGRLSPSPDNERRGHRASD